MTTTTIRGLTGRGRARLATVLIVVACWLTLATSTASAATGWTGPALVGPAATCSGVVAAIEGAETYHVAAACGGQIRVSSSRPGGPWTTTFFAVPRQSIDERPEIAIDGTRLYVAFTRDVSYGCGPNNAGVYYRWRDLPNGRWSAAIRVGGVGDMLRSFRVVGGRIHATVTPDDGVTWYETSRAGTLARYRLVDSYGASSLRIGSDGRARIAYEGPSGLRYAVFTGSGFTRSSIPGTNRQDMNPVLVLDAGNKAHVVWTHVHRSGPRGCVDDAPEIVPGTYYATNRTGAWTAAISRRITTDLGPTSLTLDPSTGQFHIVVGGASGLRYFTKPLGGSWRTQLLTSAAVSSTAIRLDPASGGLLAVYTRTSGPNVSASIYAFTKP